IHRLDVRYLAGAFGLRPVPSGFVPPIQLLGHLRLVPRSAGYDLIVTDWRAGFSDVSLQGTADVTGLGTTAPRVSADLSSSSVPLKQTLNQVPTEWIPPDLRNKLFEHAVEGFVSVHDTHVEGALGQDERLHIAGTVEIRNGRFLPGGTHPAVRELSATVFYDLEQIRVTALRGIYGPVHFSDGVVLITEWRQDPMVDARISGEVGAADLITLLNNQGRFPQMTMSLSQYEQVTGEVGMVAHVTGRPGKGDLDIEEVSVAIHHLGFRHQNVPVPFRQIEAAVRILPKEVHLVHLSGHAGFARVEAGGSVTLEGEPSFQGVALKITADGEDLAPWLRGAGGEKFKPNVEGLILLNVSIAGHVRVPRFQGRLTMDGAALEVPHVFSKSKGAPAGIRFEGELHEDRLLSVRRCELILPPVRLTGQGHIRLADELEFQTRIASDALSLKQLPRGVRLGPVSAGLIKAELKMEGRATDRASWVTSGRLHFDNGVVEEQFQDPIRNVFMRLHFDGKNIDLQRLAFTVGDSDIRLSGSIADWLEAPRAKLVVQSSQISVESLALKASSGSSSSDSFPVTRSWWANGSVEATLLIDSVYYERFLLTGLSCRVRLERGTLTIDRISGDTDDGHLAGRVILNTPERGPRSVRSMFGVSGVPVDRIFSLIDEQPRISGWMAARGAVQAELNEEGLFRSSINSRRPITIVIQNGRLYSPPVISKVLLLMNLPALLRGRTDLTKDGLPLDRLKVVFGVEDGIIKINEFLLDSPVLKISATGQYNFMDDKYDAVVVASPLGQYSDLLKSVPLFGKLFAGERRGFDTAVFEVKGSAKDPNVIYLPAESLMFGAKGTAKLAFDLLVNAITLPQEAFSMADDNSPVEEDAVQEGHRGL
ncbi:MAG: AsmA-like C-terminal domain-containing protein, partial [Nitrospira sp.]